MRLLHTLQQDHVDSAPPSALRPWHARTFVDSAVQRLSIALQRSIQRDQILRSHLRRAKRGGDNAPDGYYHGCGDGGYESGAASSSSSDGGGGPSARSRRAPANAHALTLTQCRASAEQTTMAAPAANVGRGSPAQMATAARSSGSASTWTRLAAIPGACRATSGPCFLGRQAQRAASGALCARKSSHVCFCFDFRVLLRAPPCHHCRQ